MTENETFQEVAETAKTTTILTTILDSHGKPAIATSVVKGDAESYKIKKCGDCGHAVAWVKSKKGNWFLANAKPTKRGQHKMGGMTFEGFRVYNFEPHFKDCGLNVASSANTEIRQEVDRRMIADKETMSKWFHAKTPDGKIDYSVKERMEAEFEAQIRAEQEAK